MTIADGRSLAATDQSICGACGGQTGEVNVRVLAMLLNDPPLREALRVELQHLQKTQGSTTLFVTHDQIEALTAGQSGELGTPRFTSGDRVTAENFLQHAEHYARILIAAQEAANERREAMAQQSGQGGGDGDEIASRKGPVFATAIIAGVTPRARLVTPRT